MGQSSNAYELPLQGWELDDARGAFVDALLVDQFELRRQVNSPTVSGGQTRSYLSLGFFPCRFEGGVGSGARSKQVGSGDAARFETWWQFSLSGDLLIEPTDQLILRGAAYQPLDGDNQSTTQFINTVFCRRLFDIVAMILTPGAIVCNPTTQQATLHIG